MENPSYPDEALIASIQHQGEKLGYLVAQIEEMFKKRARYDRHQATVHHTVATTNDLTHYLDGEITIEQLAENSAVSLQFTSDVMDSIKDAHQHNLNTLNQMVLDAITRGKAQATDLDRTLEQILNESENTNE
jgi:hypothetical protein